MRRAIHSSFVARTFLHATVAVLLGALAALAGEAVTTPTEVKKDPAAPKPPVRIGAAAVEAPAAPSLDQEKKKNVSTAEQFEFQQAKISAEMTQLEERMFRLSESLKAL